MDEKGAHVVNVWVGLVLLAAAIVILLLKYAGAIVELDPAGLGELATGLLILLALGGALVLLYRDKVGETMKMVGIWVLIFIGLLAVYAYRYELISVAERVASELLPQGTQVETEGPGGRAAVRIRREAGGHFIARVRVNNTPISMIVDTGASAVVLRPEDAYRAGVEVEDLRYAIPVQTANGETYAARVRLDSVSVGGIYLRRVDALITRPGTLHQSLLGMSFLRRLQSYEFRGDYLELRS